MENLLNFAETKRTSESLSLGANAKNMTLLIT